MIQFGICTTMNLTMKRERSDRQSCCIMKKYECLVVSNRITEKIIRWFTDSEHAYAWLELEGYKVIQIKELV